MNKQLTFVFCCLLLSLVPGQIITSEAGTCICKVIIQKQSAWWTMRGWDQSVCNSYVDANAGRTILMGNWRLITCQWKPFYSLRSVKNEKICSADNFGQGPLICDRSQVKDWQKFYVIFENNTCSIQSIVSKKYVSLKQDGSVGLSDDSAMMEIKIVEQKSPHSKIIAIKASLSENLYLSVRENMIIGVSENIDLWEQFRLEKSGCC